MAWKHLTFILIPHSQSKIKQIRIHRTTILGMVLFFIVAIGVMIFYIIGFQRKSFLLSDSREIQHQNIILKKIVTELDSSLTAMSTKIDSIETMTEQTRLEAKISDRDLKLARDEKIQRAENVLKLPLHRILSDIDRLERRSFVFEHNFNTLYNKCMENNEFLLHVPSIRPATGFISKEFRFLQHSDNYSFTDESHPGVTITNVEGTPIVATADGVVRVVSTSDELGRYIEIDHQNRYRTRYTYLQSVPQMEKKIRLKPGDKVKRGQQIGSMGRTGISIKAIAPQVMYTIVHNGTYVNPDNYFFVSDPAILDPGETYSEQNQ